MSGKTYVGIDVSKARLDVAILPSGEIFAVDLGLYRFCVDKVKRRDAGGQGAGLQS